MHACMYVYVCMCMCMCIYTQYIIHISRCNVRNFVRIMCQGGNHFFLAPRLQKSWGSACHSNSKLLKSFYISSIGDSWRAVSISGKPSTQYFHWFLTCTGLRRNHRVLACSEEHNPADAGGSNTTSLEMEKRRGLLSVGCQKISGNQKKKKQNERNEWMTMKLIIYDYVSMMKWK